MTSAMTRRNVLLSAATQRIFALLCAAGVLVAAIAGCSRPDGAAASKPPASPRETIKRLIDARTRGQYQDMRELIVPQRAQDVVTTLAAVDDFLSVNQLLCDLVAAEVGVGAAAGIDQSQLAYHLDVFSRCVSLLDESVSGDDASVSFLVDEQLPARHAQLRRIGGQWRYDPGEGDYTKLGAAFERMAYGLRQVLDGLRHGRLSAERYRQNPQELLDEVRIRLTPGVKMLPQSQGQTEGGQP